MSDSFYKSIAPVDDFEALVRSENYVPLPEDWSVVVADVADSTGAIEAGDYKAVNTVGVSVIAATVNVLRPVEIPYIFGGDGARICIPGRAAPDVARAMSATTAMATESFGLELRAAVVPVSHLRELGHDVLVARHRVSPHYVQCALHGGGAEFAERSLKRGELPAQFLIIPDPSAEADYSGLECRWGEIPSPFGETVAVIIDAATEGGGALEAYGPIIDRIRAIYGDADRCRPVTEGGLRITLSRAILGNESRLKRWRDGLLVRMAHGLLLRAQVILGWFLLRFGVRTRDVDWGMYMGDLVSNTDFRKFDGSLRLVLAGGAEQRAELEEYLSGLRRRGEVSFGVHVAHSALMTCLIEHRQSAHFHFVDAAGGGYAAAARALKESVAGGEAGQ